MSDLEFTFCKHTRIDIGPRYAPACAEISVRKDGEKAKKYRVCTHCLGLVLGFVEGKVLP